MKAIIAAAGTGGHINPGLAIANKIMEKDPDSEIVFFGTDRGLENDLVPRAGYELKKIDAYGIARKITFKNIKNTIKTFKSIFVVKKFIKEFKPDVMIGTGGYICVPVGLASSKLKVPIVLHESNAYPGISIKFLAKKASKICLGFEDAKKRINGGKDFSITGTPTKIKKINYNKKEKEKLKKDIGLNIKNDLPLILVFGGSQGAQSINNSIVGIIEENLNKNYQIIWAVGAGNYDILKEELDKKGIDIENIENAKILPYIYNMEEMMNIADLVVCRSGAMTITEISKLEKPAIFIPYPFATENHQEYNANVLVKLNGAKMILDKKLQKENLNKMINDLIKNRKKLEEMGKNAGKLGVNDVEEKIYEEIIKIVGKKA